MLRVAAGDDERLRRLAASSVAMTPQTHAERERFAAIMRIMPMPYTSVDACDDCAAGGDRSAANLSSRYCALAAGLDYETEGTSGTCAISRCAPTSPISSSKAS
jgi:hypothetical protein